MPIFHDDGGKLTTVPRIDFSTEKVLQKLIEDNLGEVFGCRFVASEFSTGNVHSGRIDTLALSEDDNPVIIEYKNKESASLMNQALFYLDWIKDHRGDFQSVVNERLGKKSNGEDVHIDWSYIRVICIAPKFDRYALHAVKHIGAGIELWKFNRYANDVIELEELHNEPTSVKSRARTSGEVVEFDEDESKPEYSFEDHLAQASEEIKPIVWALSEFISGLNTSIKQVPQKKYLAYKLAKNVACVVVQKKKVMVYLDLDYDESMASIAKDVTGTGHWGTGDLVLSIENPRDLDFACELIQQAYLKASGN